MANEPTLIEALDDAAKKILEEAMAPSKEGASSISLTEKVKAFDAVVKWAQDRIELIPKKQDKPNGFAALKNQLRPTTRRRGTDSAVETDGDNDAESATH